MAKIKKTLQKQFLSDKLVFIDDTDTDSQFFQLREVNDVLHAGRQGFLIGGSPLLVNDTEILVEILDSNGDPIFVSPVRNYAEGQARFISIEIYEDTPVGPATLTILGELAAQPNGEPIPEQFRGTFNVKFQRSFIVDPVRINDSKIRVFETPELLVSEILAPFRKALTSSFEDKFGTGSAQGNTLVRVINPSDPTENIYTITTPSTPVSRSMEGGGFTASFTASDAQGDFSGVFTSSITSIINDNTFQVSPGLINPNGTLFVPFGTSNFTISFQDDTIFSTTSLSRSFADVQLNKLKTFSGDIARTKLFVKSIDSEGDFEIIGDQLLESLEVMTTSSVNLGPATEMGNFFAQEIVDEFWVGGTITESINPPYVPDAGAVIVSRNTNELIDSMFISNALELKGGSGSSGSPTKFIGLTGSVALPFIAGLEYEFGMDILCLKSNDGFVGKLEVFLSGSSFPSANPLGQKLTEVVIAKGVQRSVQRNLTANFVPSADGTGKLQFVITAGEWYLEDVFVKSSRETGFNPDCAEFLLPVFGKRFEQLQFKAQLFDPNNNVFPDEIFSDLVFFDGGNALFRGSDNRIEGTLTVSPSGSGVTITSEGFFDVDGDPVSGSAIYMGEGRAFHKDTAVLLAEDVDGNPVISFGDKLHGFVSESGEFILIISGNIEVRSGTITADKLDVNELSAITANMGTLTAGIIRDTGSKYVIDLDNRLMTMIDEQGSPVTRIRLGELGAGIQDWGIEIFNAAGSLILGATGLGIETVGVDQIISGSLVLEHYVDGTVPIRILGSLPPAPQPTGSTVFLTTDEKLYRWGGLTWTAAVAALDITGQLSESQIGVEAITITKIASGSIETPHLTAGVVTANEILANTITAAEIQALAITADELAANSIVTDKIEAGAVTAAKINVTSLSAITASMGILTAGIIRDINSKFTIDLDNRLISMVDEQGSPVTRIRLGELGTGIQDWGIEIFDAAGNLILGATGLGIETVGVDQIISGSLVLEHYVDGTVPIRILGSLPPAPQPTGSTVFLTTDEKLYRWGGLTWTAAVAALDITGQLSESQIGVEAITITKIASGSIETPHLTAGVVTANEILANTITAAEIQALAITADELAANSIVTDKIEAGAVTAAKINVTSLSAITASLGTVITGQIQNEANSAGIILSGVTGSWESYINLVPPSGQPFLKHSSSLILNENGTAIFAGDISASNFTGQLPQFLNRTTFKNGVNIFDPAFLHVEIDFNSIRFFSSSIPDPVQVGQIRIATNSDMVIGQSGRNIFLGAAGRIIGPGINLQTSLGTGSAVWKELYTTDIFAAGVIAGSGSAYRMVLPVGADLWAT